MVIVIFLSYHHSNNCYNINILILHIKNNKLISCKYIYIYIYIYLSIFKAVELMVTFNNLNNKMYILRSFHPKKELSNHLIYGQCDPYFFKKYGKCVQVIGIAFMTHTGGVIIFLGIL